MNKKGFTLIELLACLALLGVVLGIGLYVTRDTLSTSLSTLTDVSKNEIFDASRNYVIENGVIWVNKDDFEYTCIDIKELVDKGYFDNNEVITYIDDFVKVVRDKKTKVINSTELVDECE